MDTASIKGCLNNLANADTNNSIKMASLLTQIQALIARYDNLPPTRAPANATPAPETGNCKPYTEKVYTQAEELAMFDLTGYCSTHGYWVPESHTSKTCKHRGPKHNNNATRADTKGGSNLNKGWETNPNPM